MATPAVGGARPDSPSQESVPRAEMNMLPVEASPASNRAEGSKTYSVVVMRLNPKYAKSAPGIIKLCQAVFVCVALLFITTADPLFAGYLLLPLDWHLRVFVFVTVFCLMFSIASYVVHLYRLTETLRIDWNKFDFILYCLMCFALLFASSMVASAIGYYDNLIKHGIPASTKKHLVIGTVLGYVTMFLYGASAYHAGRQWRTLVLQFSPHRFASQHSTTSQPQTPTTDTASTTGNIVV